MIAYVLDPGAASTKLALADIQPGEQPGQGSWLRVGLERREVSHPDLRGEPEERLRVLAAELREAAQGWPVPEAVVSRGGPGGALAAGTYRVSADLARAALAAPGAALGPALALDLASAYGVPAFVVDPPSVDELLPEARLTGYPGVSRVGRFHVLNARAVARRAAHEVGKRFGEANVVVAHLGASVSVTAFARARAIDTTGSLLAEEPFSPQRAGLLPVGALLDLAYSGLTRAELEQRLTTASGFTGLTGTADLRELERREKTDMDVKLAAQAFVHAVAKAIGAYAVALEARPDAVAITGGVARWSALIDRIERRVGWIAPVIVLPGEQELEALAEGAGRVMLGFEEPREWTPT